MKRLKLHIGATALSFGVAAAQALTELPECGVCYSFHLLIFYLTES